MKRIPELESACNFRDFGGYATSDGRQVAWGRLYRSGVMTQLSEPDRAAVECFGVRTICDLRRPDERARWPNPRFGDAVTQLHWDGVRERSPLQILREESAIDRGLARRAMIRMYGDMHVQLAQRVRLLFASLIDGPGTPLILHCTAGKDRTGFSAALLLTVLGVPRATVYEDYLLTNTAVDLRVRLLHAGGTGLGLVASDAPILAMDRSVQDALLVADADYLDAAFASIASAHGSIAAYLSDVAGVDAAASELLRARLLES